MYVLKREDLVSIQARLPFAFESVKADLDRLTVFFASNLAKSARLSFLPIKVHTIQNTREHPQIYPYFPPTVAGIYNLQLAIDTVWVDHASPFFLGFVGTRIERTPWSA